MNLTEITEKAAKILSAIKTRNTLLDNLEKENSKIVNPTFVEIIDELEKDNKTLAQMLIMWYLEKYSINEDDLNQSLLELENASIKNKSKKKEKATKTSTKTSFYADYSCGIPYVSNARC